MAPGPENLLRQVEMQGRACGMLSRKVELKETREVGGKSRGKDKTKKMGPRLGGREKSSRERVARGGRGCMAGRGVPSRKYVKKRAGWKTKGP